MNELPKELPRPDGRGNYYLGPRATGRLPAIFMIASRQSPDEGRWMACPAEADVPFSGTGETRRIRAFDSPEAALEWLHQMARRGQR